MGEVVPVKIKKSKQTVDVYAVPTKNVDFELLRL